MDVICPYCKTTLEASQDEIGMDGNCPNCNKRFVVGEQHPRKRKIITALRWVGAVVLPPIGSCVAGVIVQFSRASACRYLGINLENPGYLDWPFMLGGCIIEGAAFPFVAYWIAPKAKFYSCSIVTVVYATLLFAFDVYWLCAIHPNAFSICRQILLIGSMIGGIVYIKHNPNEFDK